MMKQYDTNSILTRDFELSNTYNSHISLNRTNQNEGEIDEFEADEKLVYSHSSHKKGQLLGISEQDSEWRE